jgi:hypothetical protein
MLVTGAYLFWLYLLKTKNWDHLADKYWIVVLISSMIYVVRPESSTGQNNKESYHGIH